MLVGRFLGDTNITLKKGESKDEKEKEPAIFCIILFRKFKEVERGSLKEEEEVMSPGLACASSPYTVFDERRARAPAKPARAH